MTVAQTLAVTGVVTLSNTVQATGFKVNGQQVVGAQGGPVQNSVNGWGVDGRDAFNALLAELRNHGLIAP
jgi:hypothetical protein